MTTITGYKGFDKDWACRGFIYGKPHGQEFSTDKPISLCNFGFHACEFPLDIWRYFPPDVANAAIVELAGVNNETGDDSKRVGSSITIKASVSIAELVSASIEWISSKVKQNPKDAARIGSSGNDASIGSSGNDARIGSSGNDASIGSSGNDARIACAGYSAKVKAGPNSCFCLTYFDAKTNRPRMRVAHVGENGIKPDTFYILSDSGEFVEET